MDQIQKDQPKTIVAGGVVPQAITGEYARPAFEDNLTGSVLLGRYQIFDPLGVGGMGTVYLCEHTTILKKFAVKVLSAELSSRPDHVDRFLREARASSMISHPNVVEITDFGQTPNGAPFFVMEYLEGEDLSEIIDREETMPWGRVRPIIMQICAALQAAHDKGIVHRDMKPGNVLVLEKAGKKDFVKVLDFGIAKVTSQEIKDKTLTQSGTVIGTPEYMSPEQGWGNPVDHRGDIYAVGVILYELLAGRVPFTGQSLMEILNRHMYEVPDVEMPEIPHEAGQIILKAMQKDRELRFQSMTEMVGALAAVGTGRNTVEVVDEEIQAPWGNVTARFAATAAPNKSHAPLLLGLSAVALAGVAVFVAISGSNNRPLPPPQAPINAQTPAAPASTPAKEPAKAEPAPPPKPVILAPNVERVRFIINTNIDAQILDARDDGIYGMTNDADGIEVEKSKEEIHLILRADGYEDLDLNIVPNRGKTFEKTLEKSRRSKKKTRGKTSKKAGKTDATPVNPPVTPEKKPDKPTKKEAPTDLIDPFG
jgi:serine/threonine-protein kinase